MPSDAERLLAAISGVVETADLRDGELEDRLDQIVKTAMVIFDVAGAGLMLRDAEGQFHLVGASDEAGRALERAQQESGEGPGVEASRSGQIVAVDDLQRDLRWPGLDEAVVPLGVVSVLSAPVPIRGLGTGNLNVYDRIAREWTEADRAGLSAFSGVAGAMLRIAIEAHHHGKLVTDLRAQLLRGDPTSQEGA
jgi:GAF domain-containing protein